MLGFFKVVLRFLLDPAGPHTQTNDGSLLDEHFLPSVLIIVVGRFARTSQQRHPVAK